MKVLVVGSGGREHALCTAIKASPRCSALYCAPGNAGIGGVATLVPIPAENIDRLIDFVRREAIDFVVVGPEAPLVGGLVDRLEAMGVRAFGPSQAAARLEGSKGFMKDFCARHGLPTAAYGRFRDADAAKAFCRARGAPIVIKADGLAAGKGVVIAQTLEEAERAIRQAMTERCFGAAGDRVVLEECLTGPEVSFFALCDGRRALPIGTAQDHKRIFDGDRGPNTGGMGAFAPSPLVDAALHERVMREIVRPVVRGMADEGAPFAGFLYVGLMLTPDGPKVIEFNVRLGDPEAQVILPLIDEPLLPLLVASAAGHLSQASVRIASDVRVGVVIASRGYPESSESGRPIDGLETAEQLPGVAVLHAGTARRDGRVVTAGGRVLTVVGSGADFASAIDRAYAGVSAIAFDGMQFRRDIGQKALAVSQGR